MSDLPRVPLMELREYRSGNGETYFLAWLGEAKVIVRRKPRATLTGREVARWTVELEQRQPPPAGGEQKASPGPSAARTSPPPQKARASPSRSTSGRAAPRTTKREEAAAGDVLRRHGIDPASPVREDDVPW